MVLPLARTAGLAGCGGFGVALGGARNHQRHRPSAMVDSRRGLHSWSSHSADSARTGGLSRVSAASRECAITCRLSARSTGPVAVGASICVLLDKSPDLALKQTGL